MDTKIGELIVSKIEKLEKTLSAEIGHVRNDVRELKVEVTKLGVRVGNLEIRMEKLEVRMDKLEVRMSNLETRVDGLETRMSDLEEETGKIRTEMRRSFWELEGGLKFIGNRVWDDHEERIKVLEWARV